MDRVPQVRSLDDIYTPTAIEAERERYDDLVARFRQKYGGAPPQWIARAPGRVNIIGDHVDYCGFSCLPAAIQPDVLIAGRSTSSPASASRITLASTDPERFPDEVIDFDDGADLSFRHHTWGNYVRAALKGVLEAQQAKAKPVALDLVVTGNIPPGGGLSSSAAMVIASSIAVLQALGQLEHVDRTEMTEIAIVSERAVGVNSGGMDQTASVFGRQSSLMRISFVPTLTSVQVPLPRGLAFVIANSLITSEKKVTAKRHYNLRVVEARAFTALLARRLDVRGLPTPPTPKALLDGLPAAYGREEPERLRRLLDDVDRVLGDQRAGTSWESALEQLGLASRDAFEREYQQGIEIEANDLQLYKRARHVFGEALAVHEACAILASSTDDGSQPTKLGELLDASQHSLRDLCQSSCPEVDELIGHAKKAGSLGSRVTGAGWGGCTVHLVRAGHEDKLIDGLQRAYYARRFPDLTEAELKMACFATRPERGACLYHVSPVQ